MKITREKDVVSYEINSENDVRLYRLLVAPMAAVVGHGTGKVSKHVNKHVGKPSKYNGPRAMKMINKDKYVTALRALQSTGATGVSVNDWAKMCGMPSHYGLANLLVACKRDGLLRAVRVKQGNGKNKMTVVFPLPKLNKFLGDIEVTTGQGN